MITTTNFQMLKDLLKEFQPKEKGFLSSEEVSKIRTALCISERDILSLRNLRDFTVIFLSQKYNDNPDDNDNALDIMSGITHIIDLEILNQGGEV